MAGKLDFLGARTKNPATQKACQRTAQNSKDQSQNYIQGTVFGDDGLYEKR